MYSALSFDNGKLNALDFDSYRLIRMMETTQIEVRFMENNYSPTGFGEPALPPARAAVDKALYQATGRRLYKQLYHEQLAEV